MREPTTTKLKDIEASSSHDISADKFKKKTDNDDNNGDRNKFKKVEMPVFNDEDPDSWLFRDERHFQIHKLSESEKMIVSTISFEGPALNWYRT